MLVKFKKYFFILISLSLIGLPTLALAAGVPAGIPTMDIFSSYLGTASLTDLIKTGLNIFFALLGVIFVLLLIYAGFQWMTSQGDPNKIDKAKKTIYAAIAGITIIFLSFAIVTFVFSVLGKATGTGKCTTEGETQNFGCTGKRTCQEGKWVIEIADDPTACGGPDDLDSNKFANIFKFSDSSLSWEKSWSETYRQKGTIRLPISDTLTTYAFARNYLDDGTIDSLKLLEQKSDGTEQDWGSMVFSEHSSDNTFNKARASLTWDASAFANLSTTTLRVGVNDGKYYSDYLKVKFCNKTYFNGILDGDETGIDCGGACGGACDGESCSVAGDETCSNDNCSSGLCDQETCLCVSRPTITYVDPANDTNNDTNRNNLTPATTDDDISNGAPGNYITIWGRNFGNATGTVYFEIPSSGYRTPLSLAPCVKSWSNNQIVAIIPQKLSVGNNPVSDYSVIVSRNNGNNQALFSDGWPFLINDTQRPGLCSASPSHGVYPDTATLSGNAFPAADPRDVIWLINNSNVTSTKETDWTTTSVTDTAIEGTYRGRTSLRIYNGSVFSNSVFFQLSAGQVGDPCGYDSQSCDQDGNTCQYVNGAQLDCQFCQKTNPDGDNYNADCDLAKNCTCQIPTATVCGDGDKQDCYVGGCKGVQTCSDNAWGNCVDDSDGCLPYLNNRSGIAAFAWAFTAQKKTGPGMSCRSEVWDDDTCDINGCIGQNLFCNTEGNSDEWVEIYNPTGLELSFAKIRYGVSSTTYQERDLVRSVQANQYLVISSSTFNPTVDLLSYQGYIALVDADGSIIDEVSYGATANTFGLAPMSFGRKKDGLDTNSNDDFASFVIPSKGKKGSGTAISGHLVINEASIASDPCTCMPTTIACKAGQVKSEGCEPVGQCDYVKRCQANGVFGQCQLRDPGCVPYALIPSATVAEYSWAFNANNGDNGSGPKVITDCDRTNNCEANETLPSPSPWSGKWNQGNYPNLAISNQYACLNAVISARFTKSMDYDSVRDLDNVKVLEKTGTGWAVITGSLIGQGGHFYVRSSGGNLQNDHFEIIIGNNKLKASTTYTVFLSKNIKDELGRSLESDENGVSSANCDGITTDPGVCWTFETRAASDPKLNCDLGCVNCSPTEYFNRYYGQEKNHDLNPISRDNVCMILDRSDYGWDWSEREQSVSDGNIVWNLQTVLSSAYSWLTNPLAVDGNGVATQSAGSESAGLATTTAYRETAWQKYADASSWFGEEDRDYFRIAGEEKINDIPGYCLAHNDFTDPVVIENQYCTKNIDPAKRILQSPSPWKGQRDACVNAVIFALFSRNMKNDTLVDTTGKPTDNVKLYKCNGEAYATSSNSLSNCFQVDNVTANVFEYNHNELTLEDLQEAADSGANTSAEGIRIFTPEKLIKNTWYKVVIKGGKDGVRGGNADENAEGVLQVPNPNTKFVRSDVSGYPESYYWYFRTGNEECPIDEVNVLPQAKLMSEVGLTQEYESDPTAANCNHLNPFSYTWNWQSLINPFDERCLSAVSDSGNSVATICALGASSCNSTDNALTAPFVKAFGKQEGLTNITARAENTQGEGQAAGCATDKWGFGKLQIGLGKFRIVNPANTDCLNSEISGSFSKNALTSSIKVSGDDKNVLLYECQDEECLGLDDGDLKGLTMVYPNNGNPAATGSFLIKPSALLTAGNTYRVVVKGGDAGIKSEQGAPLEDLNFSFGTNEGEECDKTVAPWDEGQDNGFCGNSCTYLPSANLCGTKSEQCNNKGLVAYYDFNNQIFNRTGLVAYGAAVSGWKYVPGIAGQGLNLEAAKTLSLNNAKLKDFVSSRKGTISLWARPLNTSGSPTILRFKSTGNLNLMLNITSISPLAFRVFYGDGSGSATVNSGGNYKIADWRHLTIAYEVSDAKVLDLKLFVDGKLADQKTIDDFEVADISEMALGINSFSGDIDELAIYNRVLSDQEVAALYSGKSPKDVTYNCGLNCQNLGNSFTTTTPGVYADLPICGNGKVEGGEDCDDGNNISSDNCSDICRWEGSAGSSGSSCGNGRLDNGQPDSYSWVFQLSDDTQVCQAVSFGDNPCPNGVWSLTADHNITNLQFKVYQGANASGAGCISDADFSKLSFWQSIINYFAKLIKKFFGFGSATAANFWCPVSQTTLNQAELDKIKRGNYYATTTVTDLGAAAAKTIDLIAYPNNSDNLQINLIRQDSNWGKKTEYKLLALYERDQVIGTSTAHVNTLDGLCALNSVRFDIWPKGLAKDIDSFFCASDPQNGKPDECGRYTESPYDDDMSAAWTKNQDSGYDLDGSANIDSSGATINPSSSYLNGNQHLYRLWAVSEGGYPVRANFHNISLSNISGNASKIDLLNTSSYNGDLWVTPGFKAGRSLLTVKANDIVPPGGERAGGDVAGDLPIVTFLCNNPWPSPENFPFMDSATNCLNNKEACINTNFSTYYCRDAGVVQKCVKGDRIGQECQNNAACWNDKGLVMEGSCQIYTTDDLPDLGAYKKIALGKVGNRLKEFLFAGIKAGGIESHEIAGNSFVSRSGGGTVYKGNDGSVGITNAGILNYEFVAPQNGKYKVSTVTSNNSNISILPSGFNSDYGGGSGSGCARCFQGDHLAGNKFQHNFIIKIDGVEIARIKAEASAPTSPKTSLTGESVSLAKGKHAISVEWANDCCCFEDSCLVANGGYGKMDSNFRLHKLVLDEVVSDSGSSSASDGIGIRIYSNPDYYSPTLWYKNQFPTTAGQANLQELIVDGNQAVREGRTTYVNAPDLGDSNNPGLSDLKVYSDILLISYNEGASTAIQNIYGQLLENLFFNAGNNIYQGGLEYLPGACSAGSQQCFTDKDCQVRGTGYCLSQKAAITRDNIRLSDVSDIYAALKGYHDKLRCSNDFNRSCTGNAGCYGGGACGHYYPNLAAGTYIAGKTLSVWPSWQATLAKELGATLPVDPINRILKNQSGQGVKCSTPYNPETCWDEKNKALECNLSQDSEFYSYYGNRSGALAKIYSGYESMLHIWQTPPYLGYNPFNLFDGQLAGGFCSNIADACGNGRIDSGENCSNCPLDAGCGVTGTSCQGSGTNWSCRQVKNCGDGYRNLGEECDCGNNSDGKCVIRSIDKANGDNGSGCSSECLCEDGYDCSNDTPKIICGDGQIKSPETCEFIFGQSVYGNFRTSISYNGQGVCNPLTCQLNSWVTVNCNSFVVADNINDCLNALSCGDGIKQDGEQCDCGSTSNAVFNSNYPSYSIGQSYSPFGNPFSCISANTNTLPAGLNNQAPFCNTNCRINSGYCGDGIWNSNEQCDRALNGGYCCNNNCTRKTDGVCANSVCNSSGCWAPNDGRCDSILGEPPASLNTCGDCSICHNGPANGFNYPDDECCKADCSGFIEDCTPSSEDDDGGETALDCAGADWQTIWGAVYGSESQTACTIKETCSSDGTRVGNDDPACDKYRNACPNPIERWAAFDELNNNKCCSSPENGIDFNENFAIERACSVRTDDRITLRACEGANCGWVSNESGRGVFIQQDNAKALVLTVQEINDDQGGKAFRLMNSGNDLYNEGGNVYLGSGKPGKFHGYYFDQSGGLIRKSNSYYLGLIWDNNNPKYWDVNFAGGGWFGPDPGTIEESNDKTTLFTVCDENFNCDF